MAQNSNYNKDGKFEVAELVKYVPASEEGNQQLQPEQDVKRSDTLYLLFSVITGMTISFMYGISIVWSSPAIVKLKSNDTNINPLGRPITTIEISSLIGIRMLTEMLGFLFLVPWADKIGRKLSLQIMALGMFLSLIGLAFSTTVPVMTSCACVLALFIAGGLGILQIYVTEVCEDHNRAKYSCLMSGFVPIGQLYTYIVGPIFGFRNFTLLLMAPLVFFLIVFVFAPESPVYSLSKGRKEECKKILKKLRRNKTMTEIDTECDSIVQSLHGSKNKRKSNSFIVFKSKEGRWGLLLALLPITAQNFSGMPIMMPLLAPIFNEAGVSLSGSTIAIIVGSFKVSVCIFTSLIVQKAGKRSMLLLSPIGMVIPMSALGFFFYLKHIDSPLISHLQWLPVVSILSCIFFYALGLGPLPLAIMGELFPTDVRSSAIAFVTTVATGMFAIYLFIFPLLAEFAGIHVCMWIFGITNIIFAIVIYLAFPETKGMSVQEIQGMLISYSLCKTKTVVRHP